MTCVERTQCIVSVSPPQPPPYRSTVKRRLSQEPEISRLPKLRRCNPTEEFERARSFADTPERGSRTEPRLPRAWTVASSPCHCSRSGPESPQTWPTGESGIATRQPDTDLQLNLELADSRTPTSGSIEGAHPQTVGNLEEATDCTLVPMGNCIARKSAGDNAKEPKSEPASEPDRNPREAPPPSGPADQDLSSSDVLKGHEEGSHSQSTPVRGASSEEVLGSSESPVPGSASSGRHGNRRRLSLIHAEPITHASEEGPRGTAKVYPKKPNFLESKLSLEGLLAQNGLGTRLSIAGTASHRVQTNFESKMETLRGNARATILMDLGIGHVCRKGLKPESPNQDDFFVYHLENIGLYGVFDGHGPYGHDIANFVQQNLPKFLYSHEEFESNPSEALRDAFRKTQIEIERSAERKQFDAALSGCTATVVIHDMKNGLLHVAHVGDSRAVIGRRSETNKEVIEAVNLTEDHKPTLIRERARIESCGGEVKRLEGDIPHRVFLKDRLYPGLAMSRALGDLVAGSAGVSSEPDIGQWNINQERDLFIVLCSDGVWEFISSDEAVQMVVSSTKGNRTQVQHAADSLARESWNRWIQEEADVVDDITVEVIFL